MLQVILLVHIKAHSRIIITQAAFRPAAYPFRRVPRRPQRSAPRPCCPPGVKDPPAIISQIGARPDCVGVSTKPDKTLQHATGKSVTDFCSLVKKLLSKLRFNVKQIPESCYSLLGKRKASCLWLCPGTKPGIQPGLEVSIPAVQSAPSVDIDK